MLQRIRLAMQTSGGVLGGPGTIVELDESWIGGKAKKMNAKRRGKVARNAEGNTRRSTEVSGKAIVMGMLQRGGRVKLQVVPNVRGATLRPIVRQHVAKGGEAHGRAAVIPPARSAGVRSDD